MTDKQWEALCADIKDRRGLKWEWDRIDEDIKLEIRKAWEKILNSHEKFPENEILSLREEGTKIPIGVSLTETLMAWYINIRTNAVTKFFIRVRKEDFGITYELKHDD
jgi:hypothetical protein